MNTITTYEQVEAVDSLIDLCLNRQAEYYERALKCAKYSELESNKFAALEVAKTYADIASSLMLIRRGESIPTQALKPRKSFWQKLRALFS